MLSRLARLVAGEGYADGLQPVQLQTLRFLAQANRFTRTPRGVTAWLGLTKGTVSQTLGALERKGLVARTPDATDRRVVRLDLTSAGQTVVGTSDDVSESLTRLIDEADQAAFARIVQIMLKTHLSTTGRRTMGLCSTCRHFEKAAISLSVHRCMLLDVTLSDADSKLICIEQEAA